MSASAGLLLTLLCLGAIAGAAESYPRPELSRPAAGEERWLAIEAGEDGRAVFETPESWGRERVLLHPGGVAADIGVTLNERELSPSADGSFDLSDALRPEGEQSLELVGVRVAWAEPVPDSRVKRVRAEADIDQGSVTFYLEAEVSGAAQFLIAVSDGDGNFAAAANVDVTFAGAESGLPHPVATAVQVPLPNAELWSPETPTLYRVRVKLRQDGEEVDAVESRFAMRKIDLAGDRLRVNNMPRFLRGLAMNAAEPVDPAAAVAMGFNIVRVVGGPAPALFYHQCDTIGLLVWQELPAGDGRAMRAGFDVLRGHPSLAVWEPVPQVASVYRWLRRYDAARLTAGGALGDFVVDRGSGSGQVALPIIECPAALDACETALGAVDRSGAGYLIKFEGEGLSPDLHSAFRALQLETP